MGDVIALIALLLAIPGTVIAIWQMTDRMKRKEEKTEPEQIAESVEENQPLGKN